jgi:hypothetical protein
MAEQPHDTSWHLLKQSLKFSSRVTCSVIAFSLGCGDIVSILVLPDGIGAPPRTGVCFEAPRLFTPGDATFGFPCWAIVSAELSAMKAKKRAVAHGDIIVLRM